MVDHALAGLLARRYRQGDRDAFERLVRLLKTMVKAEARDSSAGDPLLERELRSSCLVGLERAARKWDPDGGRNFVNFAKFVIRRELIDEARRRGRAARFVTASSLDQDEGPDIIESVQEPAVDHAESIDKAVRLKEVESAWRGYAATIDDDDLPFLENYILAGAASNRIPRQTALMALAKGNERTGQMSLFILEADGEETPEDAMEECKRRFARDGWAAVRMVATEGYKRGEAADELKLPREFIGAFIERVMWVCEHIGEDRLAA